MRPKTLLPIAFLVAAGLSACASPASERALLAQQTLIGMPKSQLLSCAGVPDRSRREGTTEYFTYENERFYDTGPTVGVFGGSGHVGAGVDVPLATRIQSDYCEATFTLVDGRVARLVYNTSRGGGLSRYAECARIVESCLAAVAEPGQN